MNIGANPERATIFKRGPPPLAPTFSDSHFCWWPPPPAHRQHIWRSNSVGVEFGYC